MLSLLFQNMVGPGDVDNDLEPEVKDECNTKYGDVIKVLIHEVISEKEMIVERLINSLLSISDSERPRRVCPHLRGV